jgi:high-affinity K+ transport system ATPase subunit B
MIANEYTAKADDVRQVNIAYVKEATAKMKSLLENINDKDVRKQVEKVYDVINSSPVKSHPSMAQVENDILVAVDELDDVVSNGDKERIVSLAKSLVKMVDERNLKLREK